MTADGFAQEKLGKDSNKVKFFSPMELKDFVNSIRRGLM